MGVQRLKIKNELNYRPGPTSGGCSDCNHYEVITFSGFLTGEPRCRLIGLNSGRMFRINPTYICDRYDNSEAMARLLGKKEKET